MFNSEVYIKNINTNNVQQVSGSLIKTDAKSVFIRFDKGSRMEDTIFDVKPTIDVENSSGYYDSRHVTVLQVMLGHDNSYICEVVIDE